MKKTLKNLLVLSVVGCGLVLASCSSVQAKPNGLDDKLVNFTKDNTEYSNLAVKLNKFKKEGLLIEDNRS